MMKKWLYGVALGALLMAGEAFGVTVHDVLSNGFWSAEHRGTFDYVEKETRGHVSCRQKKIKNFVDDKGVEHTSFLGVFFCSKTNGMRWKGKEWYNCQADDDAYTISDLYKINVVREAYKEKITEDIKRSYVYDDFSIINTDTVYMNKPKKKEARPIGPYVVDDWFSDAMESYSWRKTQFYGTEHTAVTNIISDNEAYITGTISQTGHVDEYMHKKVDKPASLLRTYTQHITTDEDHVYVEQEITEDAKNAVSCNCQNTYQSQYTATFKKGRWKGETETITVTQNSQATDWYRKQLEQNTR